MQVSAKVAVSWLKIVGANPNPNLTLRIKATKLQLNRLARLRTRLHARHDEAEGVAN